MNVLFIADKIDVKSGGFMVHNRNLNTLKRLCGNTSVFEYYIEPFRMFSALKVIKELRCKNMVGMDNNHIKNILDIIHKNDVSLLWLDTSQLGQLAKIVKLHFPKIKVVTFFQNVEYVFIRDMFQDTHHPKFIYRQWLVKHDEALACQYSDKIIALNERDSKGIENLYGRKADTLIPVSLKDDVEPIKNAEINKGITGLFLGSNFPPNVNGIRLFIESVLPKVNMKLIVAGSGMDALRNEFNDSDKLEIHGFVDDLRELYASVNFMVMPIFSGSGMKVKTAEALKYGKYIFASIEAVEGYNVTSTEVCVCRTLDDFVKNINEIGTSIKPYNPSSRELFLKRYSYDATDKLYEELFKSIKM